MPYDIAAGKRVGEGVESISEAKHAFFCHPRPELYHARSADGAWAMSLEFLRHQGVAP
ncbi:MAG TPA: hypothetical protein VIK27_06645 [Candidatus Aquilonibacter sp.]